GGIERLQARDDLAGGEHLDLKLVVGHFGDVFRQLIRAAIDSVERFRETGGEAPLDLGRGLGDRRRGHGGRGGTGRRTLQTITKLHCKPSPGSGTFPVSFITRAHPITSYVERERFSRAFNTEVPSAETGRRHDVPVASTKVAYIFKGRRFGQSGCGNHTFELL